jgi:D-glycero-alpha-D-manno-heptose 1-phosphate guanylyltransferase
MTPVSGLRSQVSFAAVVLAGGFGTRLRSVVREVPKPMAPVAGRPFVEWVVRYLAAQGVSRVVLSTGYMAGVIAEHFDGLRLSGIEEVRCVPETDPLGTAGGFLQAAQGAADWSPDVWLCLNGDSLALAPLGDMVRLAGDGTPSVLALHVGDATRYGSLEISESGRLLGFREKRPGAAWINAGAYAIPAARLADFPANRPLSWETDVFPGWIDAGEGVVAERVEGPFLDIGLPESYAEAESFIRSNAAWFGSGAL